MPAPADLIRLVDQFREHQATYMSGEFNEAALRLQFIDPMFQSLGWDIYNRQGYAEAYKHVVHEDSLKIGGSIKAPDYSFRVGGVRKFFVEAKKPSIKIKDAIAPAFQLRRYAWSAKLPLSILTDFEEFAVYDCRVRPQKTDGPATARTMYVTFNEYEERWEEIEAIFSHDAIQKGSFDKYADSNKKKRGTAEVDAAFLDEIESWRSKLARNLALRNEDLSQRELNVAVQKTIDRIVFLRICEDRGIERYGRLQPLLNGSSVYGRLGQLFRDADDRYNSGLFHFSPEKGRPEMPDEWTLGLKIDDGVLKEIVRKLYYPDSPYEFSVFPADILGQVYEQFLGKVIRLTPGHRAVIEDKPEVKKAGGVFYTPTYIVEYIVENTVGKLVEGKSAHQVANRTPTWKQAKDGRPLSVLDPACGSGSFLIGAYQYLLDWYRDWFVADDPARHKGRVYQSRQGQWRLTTAERKRILVDHIYGVDIDPQAVEVTKLSLLLKVLEAETKESIESQRRMFHERALPDLANNIKCGNSLIGPDFYHGKQLDLFKDDERLRINVFDWKTEFPDIVQSGGFDAVIGNPPWGGDIDRELFYFHAKYSQSTQDHTDSFKLFIDQGLRLTANAKLLGQIVPNTVLRQRRLKDIRSLLLELTIESVLDLGEDVFKGVVAPSAILIVRKQPIVDGHKTLLLDVSSVAPTQKAEQIPLEIKESVPYSQTRFSENADLELRRSVRARRIPTVVLGDCNELQVTDAGINYQRVNVGMQEKGKSDLSKRLLYEGSRESDRDVMYWKGADIDRYSITRTTNRFCRPYFREFVRSNEVVRLNVRVYDTTPKILLRQTADRIIATLDQTGVWFGRSIIAILPTANAQHSIEYFLGLLNSRLFVNLYDEIAREKRRVFAQVKLSKLKQLPIRMIDFSSQGEREVHDRIVELVTQMLHLTTMFTQAKTNHDRRVIQRQIAAINSEIDQLTYEVYGLTNDEIHIVEESTKSVCK
jgi:hypothetical protein